MRRLALIGTGIVACLGLVAVATAFVWGVTPREWDGNLDFTVAQFCQAEDGRPTCALLEQEPASPGHAPLANVDKISVDAWNLPAGIHVGDLVLCHVHQQDAAIDSSDTVTRVDGCHS
ncbi:hypothetical protein [Kutzneria kofuensis]|uniref:Uncharacterized protein n=1 Tax=Kutzneria kofuensis TaxID=103725 RepID=A0A7W9KHV3_9PSEU|nr:hypothetical protein [Kutzneria kofuensis]MBB5892921.1 hypothetical protein [Kutzneria kofuensis]